MIFSNLKYLRILNSPFFCHNYIMVKELVYNIQVPGNSRKLYFYMAPEPYDFQNTAASRSLDRLFLLKFPSVLFHLLQFYMAPINHSISTSSFFTAFQNHNYLYNEEISKFTSMCYCLLFLPVPAVDH